jgi:hypothetical protein
MKKFLGVLGSILLLVFGSIEFANSTVIGADDYTKNWFFETAKVKEHSSNALRRSNIKKKHTKGKKQNKNVATCATPNVVTNGNFTNELAAWTINNPSSLPFGITAVDIDGPGPLTSSDAFFVQTGGGFGTSPVNIFQSIKLLTGGAYTLFANIAASYFPVSSDINNLAGGVVTVTLDGKTVDSWDFGGIARNTFEYASLSASFVASSSGILGINFFREFKIDPNSPINYLDNVSLVLNNGGSVPVPEPTTVLLLGVGLLGLAGYSKKKFKKN